MVKQMELVQKEENRTRSELLREAWRQYFESRFPVVQATKVELKAIRKGRAEIRRGEFVTLQELLHELDTHPPPARRRAAINEIFTEDCVFYDPNGGVYRRDEIDRIAGAIKGTHLDFRYQPIAEPEELGNGGRVQWVSAALVRRQLTPGLTSSLPGTARLPPFIYFSTSYPELGSLVCDTHSS
jgi:predicted transcriptional regulator